MRARRIVVAVDFEVDEIRSQLQLFGVAFRETSLPDGSTWTLFYRTSSNYLLRFPRLADFEVSLDGCKVRCWPAADVAEETVRHLYLNQVLPLALSRQGKIVFHASAVEIGGECVAFIGESGRGKSTLAAAFATCGFRFLTDDGLLVESADGEFYIMPSHPSIRLWEDSEQALIGKGALMAPPVQFTSKGRFLAGNDFAFCEQPRRLRRVYFLGDGARPGVVFERAKPGEALIELVKHSFLLDIEERAMLAAHFDELTQLVSRPMYYHLDYPRSFENLALVRQAILEHALEEGDSA